jgi:acid stress-induced BolA-like protein IbaG/YrbA
LTNIIIFAIIISAGGEENMSEKFRVITELVSEDGIIIERKEVSSCELSEPLNIEELGYTHVAQIELLKNITENKIHHQTKLIRSNTICPSCGKTTNKHGTFTSNFHSVFSDHKVQIQRRNCNCGWTNKFTLEGLFGSAFHPDLLKLQCEFGSDNSFKRAENLLKALNTRHRPVNNHVRISKTIEKIGSIIGEFKTENPVQVEVPANIMVAQIDGGHIQSKDKDLRSYEVLVAKCYNLENQVERDQHHTELLKSTCIASALSDQGETIKKQLIYAALSEGMTKETIVYALSDGAKNCWSVLSILSGQCSQLIKILDWEHIARKFKHVEQNLSDELKDKLESANRKLWHGNSKDCIEKLVCIRNELGEIENKKLNNLTEYLVRNEHYLINYGEQRNNDLPYTSNVIESAVDTLINERQKKNKKMSWTREGAHHVLQIRASIASKTWDIDWKDAFKVLTSAA